MACADSPSVSTTVIASGRTPRRWRPRVAPEPQAARWPRAAGRRPGRGGGVLLRKKAGQVGRQAVDELRHSGPVAPRSSHCRFRRTAWWNGFAQAARQAAVDHGLFAGVQADAHAGRSLADALEVALADSVTRRVPGPGNDGVMRFMAGAGHRGSWAMCCQFAGGRPTGANGRETGAVRDPASGRPDRRSRHPPQIR